MIFSLHITEAPYSHQSSQTALLFAEALLRQGHTIHRVFFSSSAGHHGTTLASPPQDETDIYARWATLVETHDIDAVICISAALKRGILNKEEATRYQKPGYNLRPAFKLSGLGQLMEAAIASDRLITFGH